MPKPPTEQDYIEYRALLDSALKFPHDGNVHFYS